MTARTYRDNEIIFAQGDSADAVFYIQSGTSAAIDLQDSLRQKSYPAAGRRLSLFCGA
jgi:CRP-like cAMP-binding protein